LSTVAFIITIIRRVIILDLRYVQISHQFLRWKNFFGRSLPKLKVNSTISPLRVRHLSTWSISIIQIYDTTLVSYIPPVDKLVCIKILLKYGIYIRFISYCSCSCIHDDSYILRHLWQLFFLILFIFSVVSSSTLVWR